MEKSSIGSNIELISKPELIDTRKAIMVPSQQWVYDSVLYVILEGMKHKDKLPRPYMFAYGKTFYDIWGTHRTYAHWLANIPLVADVRRIDSQREEDTGFRLDNIHMREDEDFQQLKRRKGLGEYYRRIPKAFKRPIDWDAVVEDVRRGMR